MGHDKQGSVKIEESIAILDNVIGSSNQLYEWFAQHFDTDVDSLKKNYNIQITLQPDSNTAEVKLVRVFRTTVEVSGEAAQKIRQLAKEAESRAKSGSSRQNQRKNRK